jgi:hypothetical protein
MSGAGTTRLIRYVSQDVGLEDSSCLERLKPRLTLIKFTPRYAGRCTGRLLASNSRLSYVDAKVYPGSWKTVTMELLSSNSWVGNTGLHEYEEIRVEDRDALESLFGD